MLGGVNVVLGEALDNVTLALVAAPHVIEAVTLSVPELKLVTVTGTGWFR